MDYHQIVNSFNDCINNNDAVGLGEWMTDDHTFIDTLNKKLDGKENCLKAWKKFFRAFPDYQNVFETIESKGDLILIKGYSISSEKMLSGPALWTARIEANKISEWRVLDDNPENRALIGLE